MFSQKKITFLARPCAVMTLRTFRLVYFSCLSTAGASPVFAHGSATGLTGLGWYLFQILLAAIVGAVYVIRGLKFSTSCFLNRALIVTLVVALVTFVISATERLRVGLFELLVPILWSISPYIFLLIGHAIGGNGTTSIDDSKLKKKDPQ